MTMEDFGYVKDGEKVKFKILFRRIALIFAALLSFICFAYITVSAYHSISASVKEVETIKSPEEPIKLVENWESEDEKIAIKADKNVYEDLFGNKKESIATSSAKIRGEADPVLPPKQNKKIENISAAAKEELKLNGSKQKEEQKVFVNKPEIKQENEAPNKVAKSATVSQKEESVKSQAVVKATEKKEQKKKIIRVQLAALTSESAAEEYWYKIHRFYPDLFSNLKSFVEEVDLGKRGVFYRLQIGNFFNQVEAESFCDKYVAKAQKSKADCIIVE